MIFIDSNVPMFLVGAPHPHKHDAQQLLKRSIRDHQQLVTSVEVLQEILHRYRAIDRDDAIQPAFDAILGVVDEVFSITLEDVERAKEILIETKKLSARDALHLAVMERESIEQIMSFDRGFDDYPGVTRLSSVDEPDSARGDSDLRT